MSTSDYFLKVDGINGGSLDDQHQGAFDVLGYAFDLTALMGSGAGGGASAGKTTISPLVVDLAATPGLADLLDRLASGEHIPEVTFTARKAGDNPFEYEIITLTNVTVVGYGEKSDFATRVALGFEMIEVELIEPATDGSPDVSHVFTWDLAASGGELEPLPAGALDPVVKVTTPLQYFLEVEGVAGSSTAEGHEGEFDILGYELDLASTLAAASGGGSGAGKPTFSPLIVDVALAPGLVDLLQKIADGEQIPDITFTVQRPGDDPFIYQTITLTDVTILGFEEKADFATRVAFGYRAIEVTINEQQPDGSAGAPHVFSFDVAGGGTIAPAGELAPEVKSDVSANYFLDVPGINGGATADGHAGDFNVVSYEFDLAATMGTLGGGGSGGKTTISPLILDLAASAGLADLLEKAATGEHIPTLTFTVSKAGGNPFDFQTITLSDAIVLGYEEKAGFATRVALGFGGIEVEVTEQSTDGSPNTSRVFQWDVPADSVVIPAALEPEVSTAPLDYFLAVNGITGDSSAEGHEGEFDVLSYEFDLTAAMGAVGGGGGTGKSTFSPLIVDFAFAPALVELLQKIATGQHIPDVTFTVQKPGEDPFEYQTIKLSDVTILGFEEKADFATRVAFGYSELEITINEQQPNGSTGVPHTFSFDVTDLAPVGVLAPEVKSDIAAEYFLEIAGIQGGSTDDQHAGGFDVLSYEFDLAALVAASGGGGGGTGKTTISPLIVDVAVTAGLADLLQNAAAGKHIPTVTFTARKAGDSPFEYQTITLTDAFIVGYEEKAGFATRLALAFDGIEVEVIEQATDGSAGASHVFTWDVAANGGAIAPVGALEPVVQSPSTDKYFLEIPGIDGGSDSEQHEGEFELTSYAFDLVATFGAGAGGGAGKTTFSPLTIELEPNAAFAALLDKLATGENIPAVTFTASKTGDHPLDYEIIKLSDVTIIDYAEQAGAPTRVTLAYHKIDVEFTEQLPDGSTGDTDDFDWDVDHSPVPTSGPFDYFLKVDGVNGGSNDEQHQDEFNVVGYELDLTALMGSGAGGGASAGKTTISPLILDLAATPGLVELLDRLASGEHIPEVTFTARTKGENPFTYETITLTHATVVGYEEKSGFATRVALAFETIEVEVTDQSVNGGPAPTRTFTWDVAGNGGELEPLPAGALDPVVKITTTLQYFLAVDGVTGSSNAEGHEDEFDILGYEFDLAGTLAAASGGGAGSGKPSFSPLIVDVALAPGLVDLLQKIATGQQIPEVTFTVQKPGADPFTYQTIKLTDVTILGFEEKADFATRVAFGYRTIEIEVNEQQPDGSAGAPHVFSFDVAGGGTIASVGELAPEVKSEVEADYFLDVPGINGGSTVDEHAGDFNVLSYEFDLAATMGTLGGGGSGGKTTISPLILDLAASAGLADLLEKAATGEHIPTLTFTVRKAGGDNPSDFQTITLSDAIVLGYEEKAGFATRVALGFGGIEVEVTEQSTDGSPNTSRVFQWDAPAGSVVVPAAGALDPEVPVLTSLDYFLAVNGITGDSTAEGHEGEFDVLSYEFDLTAAMGAVGGGGGTGKSTFSPLIVDFALAPALVELLKKAAVGQHIPEVTFTVQKPGEDPFEYQSIKLSDVIILGFEEKADFATRVAFGYSQLEITINEQQPAGGTGAAHTFSFDVTDLAPIGALEPEVESDIAAQYFLDVPGMDGDATADGHAGEFDVLSYEFDLSAAFSEVGGGGGTGKALSSPLILDLAATPALVELLADAAAGKSIPTVTFTAQKSGEPPFEYETITLTDVRILGYEEKSGFATRVALGYDEIEVKVTEQNPDGSRGETHTFTRDLNSGELAPLGALDPAVAVKEEGEPTADYFLKLDGIVGSSADDQHQNEFDVVGYEFDLVAALGTGGGGGGGAGKTTFSPLVIELDPSSGLVALLDKIATGQHIPSATFTASKAGTDFDYQTIKLTEVTIVGYEEQAGAPTRVTLAYRAIEVEVVEQNPDGSPGEPHVFEWNTDENHAPVITTPPTETSADVTNGAYAASGQVAFTDPDGDAANASAQLFDILPVDITLPPDALQSLRALLESAFHIDPTTGQWQFNLPQDAAKLLAANESLDIIYRVTVSDGVAGAAALASAADAAATTQDIVISIQGVNDAPVIDAIATQQVNERPNTTGSVAPDTAQIQAKFTDADLNDTGHTGAVVSVVASGATAGLALNNAALLALLTPGAVVKEAGASLGTANYVFSAPDKTFDFLKVGQKLTLSYTIAVDDHDGGVATKTAVVEINGANDAPVFASPTLFTVQENKTAIGTVVAIDVEGESRTFKLVGGDDQALFAIDPVTGALRFLVSPDYETREDRNADNIYNVVVSATDATGGVSTQAINIKVTDVSEPGKLVNGGRGNDSLTGTNGSDTVLAGDGNDTVNASDGNDIVFGGGGNDLLFGGRGLDGIYGDDGNDTLDGGLGSDLLFGGDGKDILKGGGDGDLLYGGGGNDTLDGGGGDDILAGDGGNDRFVFGPNSGSDVIADFRRGDIIEFQGDVFDSFQEVRDASRQVLGSTVIDIGDDTIVLIGVQLRDLRASDFLYT